MSNTIHVNAGRGYDIYLQRGLLQQTGPLIRKLYNNRKVAIITDSTVAGLYADIVRQSLESSGFETAVYVFPAGEKSKNHQTLLGIYSFLSGFDITRSDLIVALGGGVTGDMAGFAAATFQRGIDFIQIPTTLLAQVDSSIGGKTAVDLKEGKNLVGAFWQPGMVICDPDTLKTLDSRNFACGMAEVIKHACIRSKELFRILLESASLDDKMDTIIALNLQIKREVVEHDERETGERMLLNFGHTLGHAVEKIFRYETFTHGEAVAVGMSLITDFSEKAGLTKIGTADRIRSLLEKFSLSYQPPASLRDLVNAAANDKKRAGSQMNLVLLREIGESFIYKVPVNKLVQFFGLEPEN